VCGIVGLVGEVDRALLERITDTLAHRGPDGRGVVVGDGWGFGHRRLSIIDLAGGAQPMASLDEAHTITFNGEIYNYVELRAQLVRLGHAFRTASDTEVLLAAYREWGDDLVAHLDGMFAFAIWDEPRRRLFVARDHVGVKPLYWAQRGAMVAFASEPKALLACPWVDRALDPVALDAYVDLLYVPPPLSMFAGIRQLAPGSRLVWHAGEVEVARYWDAEPTLDHRHDLDAWAEIAEPLVRDAIRI
jgi:asparagine synthase (glutamine-hydrolysing)